MCPDDGHREGQAPEEGVRVCGGKRQHDGLEGKQHPAQGSRLDEAPQPRRRIGGCGRVESAASPEGRDQGRRDPEANGAEDDEPAPCGAHTLLDQARDRERRPHDVKGGG